MKSDITRSTFKPSKHYSGVRMQQGRVQLDADWNEQIDIVNHRNETGTTDIIGACGAPKDTAGFELNAEGGNLKVTPGRYYVDGILCENQHEVLYTEQPDLPGAALPEAPGYYLAYLDVWQRHITAVEDPSLREAALRGADTTTRTKTVWQVKLSTQPVQNLKAESPCDTNFLEYNRLIAPRPSGMKARITPSTPAIADPCEPLADGGFLGTQNQLYRVEIHRSTRTALEDFPPAPATFKWSRDNGSLVRAMKDLEGEQLTLVEPGRDEFQIFSAGQWVELISEIEELHERPGVLVRLTNVFEGTSLTFDRASATGDLPSSISEQQAAQEKWRVRKWDQNPLPELMAAKTTEGSWVALGNDGVEVQFVNLVYKSGDYWLIPARTVAGGQIEWPRDQNGEPLEQERLGIHHHYCRLAILHFDGSAWAIASDCRSLFSPLVEQTSFHYVSGDGQEALPGTKLSRPLQVGVTNGQRRVPNARVRFSVVAGEGTIEAGTASGSTLIVQTGPEGSALHGIAQCFWTLDDNLENKSQQVEAVLLDAANQPVHLPVRFNANQSRASLVSYYSLPDCQTTGPTVRSLFETDREPEPGLIIPKVPGWPDLDNDKQVTVSDILDGMLCHLEANRLPFQHTCESDLYPDQDKMQSVGDALRALCKIMARHVGYEDRECSNGQVTIRTLLEEALGEAWPDFDGDGRVTVQDILQGLLCALNADRLPFQQQCASGLYPAEMKSVGEALRALCDLAAKHVGYEDTACSNGQSTIRTLLEEALGEAWPDFDGDGRVTVQDILHALLCELDADRLPFQHQCASGLYPPAMKSVGEALRALCNIQAAHVAYRVLAQPTWQTAKDALDFLAQNAVTASATISGTFGPELETNPVVEFAGAEFDKFKIPQVIPKTSGDILSWSHRVEITDDQQMRYHFKISKELAGIFGYEIRFVKFSG